MGICLKNEEAENLADSKTSVTVFILSSKKVKLLSSSILVFACLGSFCLIVFLYSYLGFCFFCFMAVSYADNTAANRVKEPVSNNVQTVNTQPIAVPAISVDELKEMTGYFSTGAVIGEGSSGRVYYAV
ncbi:hypothetical protein NC652_024534 [Populus alba x Populus x berolinensis]|nr:hypothetical protein NC652_024534 [Populus alba x Populus x berolinensis]